MNKSVRLFIACLMAVSVAGAFADDGFGFKAGINIGTDTLPIPGGPAGATDTWNRLGFQPDFSFGDFGLGLDLTMRFKFVPGSVLEFYAPDWIPDYLGNGTTFFDVYLPKFMYVRYGEKGDPLFVKLGSIDDLTLGTGFIMGNYSNTKFLPDARIFGLDLAVDGSLASFPYVGIEAIAGNLAKLDVLGARIYVRPFIDLDLPIVKDIQVGATFVADTQPYAYSSTPTQTGTAAVYGADIIVPILSSDVISLSAFTDMAFEPNGRAGNMIGFGGKLIGLFTYGAQLRILGPGFIPSYFDANYDLFRNVRYDVAKTTPTGEGFTGWFATLGTTFLEDQVFFRASLDGPFKGTPAASTAVPSDYPHLRAVLHVEEGLVAGFGFDAFYDKYFIGRETGFFEDLVSPKDAVIGASINYKTGAAVISLMYDLKYNPATGSYDVRSSLQSTIKF